MRRHRMMSEGVREGVKHEMDPFRIPASWCDYSFLVLMRDYAKQQQ